MLWWVIYEHTCPHCAECSAVFDQKQHDPHAHPLCSPDLTPSDFFWFPQMKKVLKGKRFTYLEEVKQENGRNTKKHQNQQLQKLFWVVEKTSQWVYCIKRRVPWGWLKFKHVRTIFTCFTIFTQFLIKSSVFFLGPPFCVCPHTHTKFKKSLVSHAAHTV